MKTFANGIIEYDTRNPEDMREYRKRFQPYTHFVVDGLYPVCMMCGAVVFVLGILGLIK